MTAERFRDTRDIHSRSFEEWLGYIEGENGQAVRGFMAIDENRHAVLTAPGSRDAHHAWRGGYQEHIRQTMIVAHTLYQLMLDLGGLETLPPEERFSFSDALTVVFLHDIEKPFIYHMSADGEVERLVAMTKAARKEFRQSVIDTYGFTITPTMANALLHVEGVRDEYYVPGERIDQPLAALCHAADNLSARALYDHGRP
jgi:hypothetical protein